MRANSRRIQSSLGKLHRLGFLAVGGTTILASSLLMARDAASEDAQNLGPRTNPFAVPTRDVITSPPHSWGPVATASLQTPTANIVDRSARQSSFVGPDWSQYERVSVQQPSQSLVSDSVATMAMPTQPYRLPVTESLRSELNTPPNNGRAVTGRANAQLVSAAKKRSQFLAQQPPAPQAGSSVYLATQTAQSELEIAAKLFQTAQLDYDYRAYASAETSAWESLEKSALAIDLAASMNPRLADSSAPTAIQRLHRGKRAIMEASDFVGPFAQNDAVSISRLARSHETPVVRETLPPLRAAYSLSNQGEPSTGSSDRLPTVSEAIDRYLDYARSQFAELAAQSLLAAQTMDLVAAIRLGRNDLSQLPGPTAICLRRAAVQGQSGNADLAAKLGHHLADIGLVDEARWALGHSLSIQPNSANSARLAHLKSISARPEKRDYGQSIMASTRSQTPPDSTRRVPDVIALSPTQFAAISTSVLPGMKPSQSNESILPVGSNQVSLNRDSMNNATPESARSETVPRTSIMHNLVASFRRTLPAAADSTNVTQSEPTELGSPNSGFAITPSRYNGPPVIPAATVSPAARVSTTRMPSPKRWW
ncbi:hypothetical protein Pla100_43060 [Neorhodopirellula pilleata]|uniref:Transmembrane protein n=2 Tax=Neorhodopirellula pilleata TaxID=2714738 RepID=A0A5C6A0Z6_9BACT|nr:hypothetical protein Pla100_43060 [Neorhodopirellula pilleata]